MYVECYGGHYKPHIIQRLCRRFTKLVQRGTKYSNRRFNNKPPLKTDDFILVSETRVGLRKLLDKLTQYCHHQKQANFLLTFPLKKKPCHPVLPSPLSSFCVVTPTSTNNISGVTYGTSTLTFHMAY